MVDSSKLPKPPVDEQFVMQEFERRRKKFQTATLILLGFLICGAIVTILIATNGTGWLDGFALLFFTSFVLIIGGMVIYSDSIWRCPACERSFSRRGNPDPIFPPDHLVCPHCGVKLRSETR